MKNDANNIKKKKKNSYKFIQVHNVNFLFYSNNMHLTRDGDCSRN